MKNIIEQAKRMSADTTCLTAWQTRDTCVSVSRAHACPGIGMLQVFHH
jgi:hypothetical protein